VRPRGQTGGREKACEQAQTDEKDDPAAAHRR
jgi:hypothetical protein